MYLTGMNLIAAWIGWVVIVFFLALVLLGLTTLAKVGIKRIDQWIEGEK